MYKLLIADDEAQIRSIVRKYAEFSGYSIVEAEDGMQALEIARSEKLDAIILDIMMPELDGFSACREIRKTSDVPIIILSARGEEYDKINGLEIGADDYVVKPFSPRELMLRVDAVIRRYKKGSETGDGKEIYSFSGLIADISARKVFVDGVQIELSPKEYDLLFYMIRNRGLALSREKLITEVWGYDFYGDDRTLDTHIKLLRKSLGGYSSFIVTLRGMGYRFDAPIIEK